jgi:iron complex outermembrane receptor protein
VLNINNKLPYYDPGFDSGGLYDFSINDVRGRQFRLGLTYKM